MKHSCIPKRKPGKRTVGKQPICTARQIKLIDPVWMPGPVPPRFWEDRHNRRNYLLWLGWELRFRKMRDWYRLCARDCMRLRGSAVLRRWGDSHIKGVKECFPQYDWCEWLFGSTERGFWDDPKNRRRYLNWLGKQLGFRRPTDWYTIRHDDLVVHNSGGILCNRSSLYELMEEYLPQLDWEPFKQRPPLSVDRILQMADEHFAQHREWPTRKSGVIPGANECWERIDKSLQEGRRGLPGGLSLARLLQRYRGVPTGKGPLTEKQILAWADAHRARTGQWPRVLSGAVHDAEGETWSGIDVALTRGRRGLSGGSSLAQLLHRRRGVRNRSALPKFSERKVLQWARIHIKKTGRAPAVRGGPVPQSPGDTWSVIHEALRLGFRGFPGRSSLSKLLKRHGLK